MFMNKLEMSVAVILILLMTGCALFQTDGKVDPEKSAYQLGRLTTVAYVLGQDRLAPEQRAQLRNVWTAFDSVAGAMLAGHMPEDIRSAVKKEFSAKVKDPAMLVLGMELIDMYWGQLAGSYDFDSLSSGSIAVIILKYHDGIRAALDEYSSL